MESTNVPMSKRLIGIALAAVFIVGSIFIPGSETLGHEGVMTLGLLLALVSTVNSFAQIQPTVSMTAP